MSLTVQTVDMSIAEWCAVVELRATDGIEGMEWLVTRCHKLPSPTPVPASTILVPQVRTFCQMHGIKPEFTIPTRQPETT